ncbi:MAG: metallophosphatase family protein [Actinomycetota bacterium]|nr:metallophosphatase family protein [Actinomycetota bacterium]
MMVVVLADTHTLGSTRPLPSGAWPYIESADHILHAGDVCDVVLLDELASFAPVTAVLGNCDGLDVKHWGAQSETQLQLAGAPIGMVHDSGLTRGRRRRLRARFPEARVVVYGHSHHPCNEDEDGLLLLNPGSPTWARLAPWPSMALLWIEAEKVEAEVIPV